MSSVLFKSKNIADSFNEKYLLKSILLFIRKYNLSLTDFMVRFEELFNSIHGLYIKSGKLDDFKNKLSKISQDVNADKILRINEFNF